jgi:hypothetical protein
MVKEARRAAVYAAHTGLRPGLRVLTPTAPRFGRIHAAACQYRSPGRRLQGPSYVMLTSADRALLNTSPPFRRSRDAWRTGRFGIHGLRPSVRLPVTNGPGPLFRMLLRREMRRREVPRRDGEVAARTRNRRVSPARGHSLPSVRLDPGMARPSRRSARGACETH